MQLALLNKLMLKEDKTINEIADNIDCHRQIIGNIVNIVNIIDFDTTFEYVKRSIHFIERKRF